MQGLRGLKDKNILWLISTIVIFIDILSKILVKNFLLLGHKNKIIDNFFYITYVKNTGAAWSIFSGVTILITIITLIIVAILIYYIINHKLNKIETVSYALILGGAIGNLLNRIMYGYVIDFLDFKIFNYDYPIFNIADISIVIGVFLLIIAMIRGENNADNSRQSRKNR